MRYTRVDGEKVEVYVISVSAERVADDQFHTVHVDYARREPPTEEGGDERHEGAYVGTHETDDPRASQAFLDGLATVLGHRGFKTAPVRSERAWCADGGRL